MGAKLHEENSSTIELGEITAGQIGVITRGYGLGRIVVGVARESGIFAVDIGNGSFWGTGGKHGVKVRILQPGELIEIT